MWLVGVAWAYVVVMMTVAEATSANGTFLGAAFTFLLYGALPLSIALYLLGTPMRRRRREAASALAADVAARPASVAVDGALDPDRGGHSPGNALAPERIEP